MPRERRTIMLLAYVIWCTPILENPGAGKIVPGTAGNAIHEPLLCNRTRARRLCPEGVLTKKKLPEDCTAVVPCVGVLSMGSMCPIYKGTTPRFPTAMEVTCQSIGSSALNEKLSICGNCSKKKTTYHIPGQCHSGQPTPIGNRKLT